MAHCGALTYWKLALIDQRTVKHLTRVDISLMKYLMLTMYYILLSMHDALHALWCINNIYRPCKNYIHTFYGAEIAADSTLVIYKQNLKNVRLPYIL